MTKTFDMSKSYHADPQNLWFFRILVIIALVGIYACIGILGVVLWPIPEQMETILQQLGILLQQ